MSDSTVSWDKEYQTLQNSPIYQPLWDFVKQELDGLRFAKVIDFGCGDGKYSFLLNEMGFEVLGIDFSPNAIKLANGQKHGDNGERIRFIISGVIPLDIPDHSIDAVILLNSYHCIEMAKRKPLIAACKRVLKENGILILSVLTQDDESYPRSQWSEISSNFFLDSNGKTFQFFSKTEIEEELLGFNLVKFERLENIVPGLGKKSSLFLISGKPNLKQME